MNNKYNQKTDFIREEKEYNPFVRKYKIVINSFVRKYKIIMNI